MQDHHVALKDSYITDSDRKAVEAARQLHAIVQKVSISAIHSEADTRVHAIIMLAQAANGILHLLAMAAKSGDVSKDTPVKSAEVLFSALLAYHTAPYEDERGKVLAEFSPLVVFDALKDFERLTGEQPDEHLNEVMCRVARESATDPAVCAQINKGRAEAHRGSATLN